MLTPAGITYAPLFFNNCINKGEYMQSFTKEVVLAAASGHYNEIEIGRAS